MPGFVILLNVPFFATFYPIQLSDTVCMVTSTCKCNRFELREHTLMSVALNVHFCVATS